MTSAAPLPPAPAAPSWTAPAGGWDAHIHMLAAPDEFPPWPDAPAAPGGAPFQAHLAAFRAQQAAFGLDRALVVQSIVYGTDNSVTVEAVRALPGSAGIGLVTDDADDATLDRLVDWGIRGVRLNYVHGGVLSWDGVRAMAPRLAERGLHVQMLMNAHRHMAEIADDVAALPVPVVFDHLGWPDLSLGVAEPGFQRLRALVAEGHAHVKLSGLYRLCEAPYTAADEHVATLVAANPERCLWGSDWPHIMLGDATAPRPTDLWEALGRVVTSDTDRRRVLVEVPDALYAAP
ncbi:MAG: amidohydrolase family protein [Paracoccaceae bacterium]